MTSPSPPERGQLEMGRQNSSHRVSWGTGRCNQPAPKQAEMGGQDPAASLDLVRVSIHLLVLWGHLLGRRVAMVLLAGLALAVSGGQMCFGVTLSEL